MENPIEATRVTVEILAGSLDPTSFVMVQTSRGLDAIIDPRFETEVKRQKWYAILSRGNHLQTAADIHGRRVSLQSFILTLANPGMTLEEASTSPLPTRSHSTAGWRTSRPTSGAPPSCETGATNRTPPHASRACAGRS